MHEKSKGSVQVGLYKTPTFTVCIHWLDADQYILTLCWYDGIQGPGTHVVLQNRGNKLFRLDYNKGCHFLLV